MKSAWLGLLALTACNGAAPTAALPNAGAALEQAARMRGLVADPSGVEPAGLYASKTDRLCLVRQGAGYRIGASVNYGEDQSCLARGAARGRGRVDVQFNGGCRFTADVEGERISFPAVLPDRCARLCRGRASLAAFAAGRLSTSDTEARAAPAPDGAALCG